MARNMQTRNNKRLWGLVSSMGWSQMPCYVPSRNSDNIKKTRYHYLLTFEKQGIIIELMVPAKENLAQANFRKQLKYEDLIHKGQSAGWELKYFPVEVRSRGFANNTLHTCFKFFGLRGVEWVHGLFLFALVLGKM